MNDLPLVSICSLAYNHEPYIKDCLNGFINQKTNFKFEVLIHDDASKDGTAAIIKDYHKKYPDIIKPIFQIENQYSKGVGVTRKFNFSRVKGKYIAFCEGDDYWIDAHKLQKQVDFLEQHPEYGGISTNNRWLMEMDNTFKDSILDEGKITFEDLCKSNSINSQTILCKRALIPNLDWMQGLKIGDWALHLLVTSQQPYYRLPEITTVYRVHSGGVHSLLKEEVKLRNRVEVLMAVLAHVKLTAERQHIVKEAIQELFKKILAYNPKDKNSLRKKYLKYGGTFFNKTLLKSYINDIF